MKRLAVAALVAALGWAASAAFSASGVRTVPDMPVPQSARPQEVAGDLVLNGQHARILGFDMAGSAEDVLSFYRQRLGPRHVENDIEGDRTIAGRDGGFFVTVRIHRAVAGHVSVTLMSSHIGDSGGRSQMSADTERLLPAGSSVLQTQESVDAGDPSLLMVAANRTGLRANRDALLQGFQDRGFRVATNTVSKVLGHETATLTLASSSEDATASVVDDGAYRAVLIQRSRRSP